MNIKYIEKMTSELTQEETDKIVNFINQCSEERFNYSHPEPQRIPTFSERENSAVVFAIDEDLDIIVGTLYVLNLTQSLILSKAPEVVEEINNRNIDLTKSAILAELWVSLNYSNQGIASTLMDKIAQQATELGYEQYLLFGGRPGEDSASFLWHIFGDSMITSDIIDPFTSVNKDNITSNKNILIRPITVN
jgi:GNAT superfamily N-acetyltransferase